MADRRFSKFSSKTMVIPNGVSAVPVLDVIYIPSIDTTSGLLVVGDIYLDWLSYDYYQIN